MSIDPNDNNDFSFWLGVMILLVTSFVSFKFGQVYHF